LSLGRWKKVIDELYEEGCLRLNFTGGEPFAKEGFLDLYSYARGKGFLISILTNGQFFTKKVREHFKKSPPHEIEISLNGMTRATYEGIVRVPGAFHKVISTIYFLKKNNINFLIKCTGLRQNAGEIILLAQFARKLFGNVYSRKFVFSPLLVCGQKNQKGPRSARLPVPEVVKCLSLDGNIGLMENRGECQGSQLSSGREQHLYRCFRWLKSAFIDPFGQMGFCQICNDYSFDIGKKSIHEIFYSELPRIEKVSYQTNSQCRACALKDYCYKCPVIAKLENGNKESPVQYFCDLAERLREHRFVGRK